MTQALNLANFANKLNTSGQADNTALQAGTYGISISGNAATATSATSAGSATSATTATNVTGSVASGATGTTQSNGDNSTKIATTAYVQNMGLGWGQSWTDVTGSRTSGTTYTNSTGKPIAVLFHCAYAFTVTVGGVVISSQGYLNAQWPGQFFIVPPSTTYIVSSFDGTFSSWVELR